MATVEGTRVRTAMDGPIQKIQWTPLAAGDDGAPVRMLNWNDSAIQVKGTFGGATCNIEGTLDEDPATATWDVLSDPLDNALDLVTADRKLRQVLEHVEWLRPRLAGGDGTTALTVTLRMRR